MTKRQRILILGAHGRLGRALVRRLEAAHEVLKPTRAEVDLARPNTCREVIAGLDFDVLVNCAAIASPDVCEDTPELAWAVNAEAPAGMASLCQQRGARMIHISTDYVFGGDGDVALTEEAATQPLSVYGESKLAGEREVLGACPGALVTRVSWLFGSDKPSFPDTILREAQTKGEAWAIADKWSTPTYTEDLAGWIEALSAEYTGVTGVLNLCHGGVASWQEYAQTTVELAHEMGLLNDLITVQPQPLEGFPLFKARRPRYTPLSNALLTARTGIAPDSWKGALRRYFETLQTAAAKF